MFEHLKKDSGPNEASSGLNGHRIRTISVAMALILVVLISAGSGVYAGASFFAQQGPSVTVTTTLFTTTTSWTTSTIWSTVTSVVQGVLTTVEYTTSTSTVTVTGSPTYRIAKIVTANGNARISTAQSEFGGASGLFGGNGAYLSTPDSADWAFGSSDFTIDYWVRFNALPSVGQFMIVVGQYANANNQMFFGFANDGGMYKIVTVQIRGGSWNIVIFKTVSLALNTWYHVAHVRSGNNWYIFLNGVQQGTTDSNATAFQDLAANLEVGRKGDGFYLNGWIDDLRISKGVARWTSNFTPSTSAYTGDSNTVLLLHMDGADASTIFIDDVTTG